MVQKLKKLSRFINGRYELGYDARLIMEIKEKICTNQYNFIWAIFKKIKYNKICKRNGAFIRINTMIGKGTTFPHGISGIFISQGATIGSDCVIFHQVTIGSNGLTDSAGCGSPKVGNNVYIGAGAKIIGDVHIGNHVRIGANAVVTKDVAANSTVVMEHPRIIIHEEERDNSFVMFQK